MIRRTHFAKVLKRTALTQAHSAQQRTFTGEQQDVVVIGGGPGGYVASIKAAQMGMKTTCVEGRGTLGGTCLNVGCIPSKSLLHNSHLYHEAKNEFPKRGIKVDNLQLDLPTMLKAKDKSVGGLTKGIEGLFKKNKVAYVKGWGKVTGPNEVSAFLADGTQQKISSKNIIIATGSDSIHIPNVPIDEKTIVTSTGALEFDAVPEHLVVIGAGVIGLELGSVWARLGAKVTVVEFLDRITPGIDNEIAKTFQNVLTKQGLKFLLSTGVQSCSIRADGKVDVSMRGKNGDDILVADKVLVSVGRRPVTEGLGLQELGVAMEKKGQVTVKENWQSPSHPSIYAIGDVTNGAMLAHKAEEEGIACVETIGGMHGHVNYNAIPGVIYTHPEVACVGKTEEQLKEMKVEYNKGTFPFMANSRARTNDDFEGLVKVLADKKTDRLLGVHIIGPAAGEMIQEAVIGIEYGASSEDLARTCHAHPTLSEAFKEACMDAYDKPIHF